MWNLKRAGDEDVKKDIGECPALCVLFRNPRNLRNLLNLRNMSHLLQAELHDGEGCHHVAEVAVDILVALYVSAAQLTPPYDVVF